MSPVRYELGFYILEDDILHTLRRENLKSYILSRNSCLKITVFWGAITGVLALHGTKSLKASLINHVIVARHGVWIGS
jgi:hypothetical protein